MALTSTLFTGLSGLDVIDCHGAAERHVKVRVRVDAPGQHVLPRSVDRLDGIRIAGGRAEAGVLIGGDRSQRDEQGAAAGDAVAGDPDIVGGRGPGQIDLRRRGRGSGESGRSRRRSRVGSGWGRRARPRGESGW